jgi:putative FmdB family regulatory protein
MMPTYEYVCPACGYEFEAFQAITDGALRKCPQCKRLKLKRLIGSGAGIIFRGTGFYETDYRSKSYMEGQKKDSSSASTPAASKGNGSPAAGKSADAGSKSKAGTTKSKAKKAS